MEGTATYLYCITKATAPPNVRRVPGGIPGGTVPTAIGIGNSLWLVVAEVPLLQYSAEPLEALLRDMQWVGDVALAHEAVVEHCARLRGVTVVPMKLFTIFSSRDRAVDEIRARRREIGTVLKRIAGCEEWGVRVAGTPHAARRPTRGGARATSGAAFLAAKKQTRDDVRAAASMASDVAESAFEALASIAREVRRRDEVPEGAINPPVLDAAFLVPLGRRARFRAAAKRIAAQCEAGGAEMLLTGPWPAYNFVHPETSE